MTRVKAQMSGGCQCGAVRYHTDAFLDDAHICHCRMCQKAGGNPFGVSVGAPLDAFRWTRGKPSVFRSSAQIDRGFCNLCGTPLFYFEHGGDSILLAIGSLDQPEGFKPVYQVGIESRMSWFANLTDTPERGVTGGGASAPWVAAVAATNNQHPDHDTAEWPPRN